MNLGKKKRVYRGYPVGSMACLDLPSDDCFKVHKPCQIERGNRVNNLCRRERPCAVPEIGEMVKAVSPALRFAK